MKNRLISIFVLIFSLAGSAIAGTGPQDIVNTPHNLSSYQTSPLAFTWNQYTASNEDEICVFCHTPHGGSLDGPLWNRDVSALSGAGHYTHYTSDTLSSAVGASNRAVNSESLLCLSCHDGSISVGDNLLNESGVTPDNNAGKEIQTGWDPTFTAYPGPQIGATRTDLNSNTDLSDDHPISFSYSAVLADKPGTLQSVANVEGQNLLLFGASKNVECGTCHDPHVNYMAASGGDADYEPFLAIPNTNSAMCLACHIK